MGQKMSQHEESERDEKDFILERNKENMIETLNISTQMIWYGDGLFVSEDISFQAIMLYEILLYEQRQNVTFHLECGKTPTHNFR